MKRNKQNTPNISGETGALRIKNIIDKYPYLKLALIVLVFGALGVLIYSNTFESPFIFDDRLRILDNPTIRIDELTAKSLWNAAFGDASIR